MLEHAPTEQELSGLLGQALYEVWQTLCSRIEAQYEMERLWNSGGKAWTYEYKYRKGGKTLCALYAKEDSFGFMMIFGKEEREKFEAVRGELSPASQAVYDGAKTYHDGKWVMFEPKDGSLFPDFDKFLLLKRKPNKK